MIISFLNDSFFIDKKHHLAKTYAYNDTYI